MSYSQNNHDQQELKEFTIKVKDRNSGKDSYINLSFKLKNQQKLQFRSYSEKSKDAPKNLMPGKTFPDSLKSQFGIIDNPLTNFEFDTKQFQCKFTRTSNYDQNIIYEISLVLQNKGQEYPQHKKRIELGKLQERQNELKKNITKLQEELKKVDQCLDQKTKQLSSLTQQIAKKDQELNQTKKSLEEVTKRQVEIIDKVNKVNFTLDQKQKKLSSLTKQIAKADNELSLKLKLLEETQMRNQVAIRFKYYPQYEKYISLIQKGKMHLLMGCKGVTDKMVQEISQCDLSRIYLLQLGGNKITDNGFDLLFKNREWPVLLTIHLDNNKIQNIHSLNKIPNLQLLYIYNNELSFDSCTYMCEHLWPELTVLWISFKQGVNDKCWQKLLTVMKEKFPKLNQLWYCQTGDVSPKNHEKIGNYCMNNKISLKSY